MPELPGIHEGKRLTLQDITRLQDRYPELASGLGEINVSTADGLVRLQELAVAFPDAKDAIDALVDRHNLP